MNPLRKWVPAWAKDLLRKTKYYLFYQGRNRYCPVCEKYSSEFLPMLWEDPRHDVKCPYCHSFERHRLLYLFLRRKSDFFTAGRKVVHCAPEPCLRAIFEKELGPTYKTADMFDPTVDIKMDICDIQFPDESFGVILCSHVLEHVPDDQKAMREFSRILTPDGWAILLVPYTADRIVEDPTITDKAEKDRIFGLDHVRRYAPAPYVERLRKNHFEVTVLLPHDFVSPEEVVLMGLTPAAGDIVLCTKAPKTALA